MTEPADRARDLVAGAPIAVDVAQIEKELEAMWRSASAEHQVTRACAWNLIVKDDGPVRDGGARVDVRTAVDAAVAHVPSRTLLVQQAASDAPRELEAFVSANCLIAPGGGKLLCTESIAIHSRGREGALLVPSVLRALLVPDVPAALFWSGPPPRPGQLTPWQGLGVKRLIVDSALSTHALTELAIATADGDSLELADLNWLRLARLRSVLASLFDSAPADLTRLRDITVHSTPAGVRAAKLFLGWLMARLGFTRARTQNDSGCWAVSDARGATIQLQIAEVKSTARRSGVTGLTLALDGGAVYSLAASAGPRADAFRATTPHGVACDVEVHEPPLDELLVAALGARGRDALYRPALVRAGELEQAPERLSMR